MAKPHEMASVVTRESVEHLNFQPGDDIESIMCYGQPILLGQAGGAFMGRYKQLSQLTPLVCFRVSSNPL